MKRLRANPAPGAPLLERASNTLLVAEAGGELVGTVVAGWDGWQGSISRLAVSDALRGQGVARRLVEAGELRLRERGAEEAITLVPPADDDTTAFWRSMDYRHSDTVARFAHAL